MATSRKIRTREPEPAFARNDPSKSGLAADYRKYVYHAVTTPEGGRILERIIDHYGGRHKVVKSRLIEMIFREYVEKLGV